LVRVFIVYSRPQNQLQAARTELKERRLPQGSKIKSKGARDIPRPLHSEKAAPPEGREMRAGPVANVVGGVHIARLETDDCTVCADVKRIGRKRGNDRSACIFGRGGIVLASLDSKPGPLQTEGSGTQMRTTGRFRHPSYRVLCR
jgi:hypothetical protein